MFDNKRKFNIKGIIYNSDSPSFSNTKGFRGLLNINELTGNFRYGIGWTGVDKDYYQNDLGFYSLRNDQRFSLELNYLTFNSTKIYNKIEGYLFISERRRFYPKVLKSRGGRMGIDLTTLDLNRIGIDFDYTSNYKNYSA